MLQPSDGAEVSGQAVRRPPAQPVESAEEEKGSKTLLVLGGLAPVGVGTALVLKPTDEPVVGRWHQVSAQHPSARGWVLEDMEFFPNGHRRGAGIPTLLSFRLGHLHDLRQIYPNRLLEMAEPGRLLRRHHCESHDGGLQSLVADLPPSRKLNGLEWRCRLVREFREHVSPRLEWSSPLPQRPLHLIPLGLPLHTGSWLPTHL